MSIKFKINNEWEKVVPTDLSELKEDSTHRVVTDEQIEQWSNPESSVSDELPIIGSDLKLKDLSNIAVGFEDEDEVIHKIPAAYVDMSGKVDVESGKQLMPNPLSGVPDSGVYLLKGYDGECFWDDAYNTIWSALYGRVYTSINGNSAEGGYFSMHYSGRNALYATVQDYDTWMQYLAFGIYVWNDELNVAERAFRAVEYGTENIIVHTWIPTQEPVEEGSEYVLVDYTKQTIPLANLAQIDTSLGGLL